MNQYCVHCGRPLDPTSQFCPGCGTFTNAQTTANAVPPAPAMSAYAAPPPAPYIVSPVPYAQPQYVQPVQYAPPIQYAPPAPYMPQEQQYAVPPAQYAPPVQQYTVPPVPYAPPVPQYTAPPVPYAPPVQQYTAPPAPYMPPVQQYTVPPAQQYEAQPPFYGAQQVYYAPVYVQQKPKRKKQKEVYDDSHLPLYGAEQMQPAIMSPPIPDVVPQYAADPAQTQQQTVYANSTQAVAQVQQPEVQEQETAIVSQADSVEPVLDQNLPTGAEAEQAHDPASPVLYPQAMQPNAQETQQAVPQPPFMTGINQNYTSQAIQNPTMPVYGQQMATMQPMAQPAYGITGKPPKEKKPKREKPKREKPLSKKARMAQAQQPLGEPAAYLPPTEAAPPVDPAINEEIPDVKTAHGQLESEQSFDAVKAQFDSIIEEEQQN